MFQTRIIKKQLHFKQPAGTSRGVYTTRNVWYILLTDTGSRHYGVGECAPLPALSCDDIPSYDEVLATACKNLEKNGEIVPKNRLSDTYLEDEDSLEVVSFVGGG